MCQQQKNLKMCQKHLPRYPYTNRYKRIDIKVQPGNDNESRSSEKVQTFFKLWNTCYNCRYQPLTLDAFFTLRKHLETTAEY